MAAIPNDYKRPSPGDRPHRHQHRTGAPLRLCRSVMTLSSAALKKSAESYRRSSSRTSSPGVRHGITRPSRLPPTRPPAAGHRQVSDILDYFVTICLEKTPISIQSADQYFSDLFMNRKKPAEEDAER